jgi:hypothetical protein
MKFRMRNRHGVPFPPASGRRLLLAAVAFVQRMNAETVRAPRQPYLKSRVESLALEIVPGAPDEVQRLADQEVARWGRIIRDRNIRLEF